MSLEASIKQYKQGLKESSAELQRLEQTAAEMVNAVDDAHDHEADYETASTELETVTASKETVKEELSEAVLTGGDVDALRDEYKDLSNREDALRDALGDALKAIEDSRVNATEVARLRAELRRVSNGGTELLNAVKKIVFADGVALSERVDAIDATLPDGDSLELLRLLGHGEKADEYQSAIEHNEGLREGSGEHMRGVADREVQRLLART